MLGTCLLVLLLSLRHAHGVAAYASIESLPFLLCRCWFSYSSLLLNTAHHLILVVWRSVAGDFSMVSTSLQFTSCSTLDATERCSDLVPVVGIPSSFSLIITSTSSHLLHRPAGLSLGIASTCSSSLGNTRSFWSIRNMNPSSKNVRYWIRITTSILSLCFIALRESL